MHMFDEKIATRVGVHAAVIYQNILFWTEKNAANEKHLYEGRFWTYNSVKAWQKLLPYLTEKQIRSAIDRLVEEGLIVTGVFNANPYDRTKWYSPSVYMDLPEPKNTIAQEGEGTIAQEGEPIPDINTDKKPDLDLPRLNLDFSRLSSLQRKMIREGSSVLVDGRLLGGQELQKASVALKAWESRVG